MRKISGFLIVLLVLFAGTLTAAAQERILSFDSNITVRPDGSMKVIETIRVRGQQRNIRRGIYRDFPVRYRDKDGYWRRVGLKILEVKRDGQPEPSFSQMSGDYSRLYIGDKNKYLPAGEFVYEITYTTTRQLRFFKDFDELYWNVTGNKWQFPIDRAVATVTLPEGATIFQKNAFTGRFGRSEGDYTMTQLSDNSIRFETTRRLGNWEGLTIAIGWQKGIVAPLSWWSEFAWYIWDHLGLIILAMGTVGIAGYFYTTWDRIGRDPEGGVIIPLFAAPKGLSPATVSYIHYRKFKGRDSAASLAFIAALVSLAVKKQLVIDKPDDTLTLKRLQGPGLALPRGEAAILKTLLNTRKSIEFKQSNSAIVQTARQKFKAAILGESGEVYFKGNVGYFIIGLVFSVVVLLLSFYFYLRDESEMLIAIASLASGIVGSLLLSMGLRRLWDKLPGGGSKLAGFFLTFIGAFALVPVFALVMGVENIPQWVPAAFGLIGAMNVVFFNLLHAPTELGRQVMDEIEGFKMYLSVAEADRMNMRGAPEVTPQVFEKFLPYAIGMGVEKPWSKALESQLLKAGTVDTAYHPNWYRGSSGWSTRDLGAATAGIVGGVAAGMAQASPPSSSGSSGGGGFSGGGGGGGGGGGW